MTPEQLGKVFDFYIDFLKKNGYEPIRINDLSEKLTTELFKANKKKTLNHLYWMCWQAKEYIGTDRIEKACRWLGFIQGCFFMLGIFSVKELKDHNKPEESD